MKIAVTGATGFIGRHVVDALAAIPNVHLVTSSRRAPASPFSANAKHVQLDIGQPQPDALVALGQPDVLVHLAWDGLPNYRSLHHFESELPRQYRFLKTLVDGGLKQLVCVGTCFEYGMRCGEMAETLDDAPDNPYALAKSTLRRQLEFLRSERPFELTWTRLFYMYGPGQPATSLYPQLQCALDEGRESFRMSPGDQLRDYLPVHEVARIIARLATFGAGAEIVNVCSGQPTSVRALVERWIAERGKTMRLDLGFHPHASHEPRAFWGSRTKLDAILAAHPPAQ